MEVTGHGWSDGDRFRPTDIVGTTELNGRSITSSEDLERELGGINTGEMIRFYVLRHRGALFVALTKSWEE